MAFQDRCRRRRQRPSGHTCESTDADARNAPGGNTSLPVSKVLYQRPAANLFTLLSRSTHGHTVAVLYTTTIFFRIVCARFRILPHTSRPGVRRAAEWRGKSFRRVLTQFHFLGGYLQYQEKSKEGRSWVMISMQLKVPTRTVRVGHL